MKKTTYDLELHDLAVEFDGPDFLLARFRERVRGGGGGRER